jgi:nucleoside phosphorylase
MTNFSQTSTLIVVALEDELPRHLIKDWRVIYTGIGKVNAVIGTSIEVEKEKPDFILNFGTAGTSSANIKGLHEVTLLKQRDMDLSPLGLRRVTSCNPLMFALEVPAVPKFKMKSGFSFSTSMLVPITAFTFPIPV